MARKRASPLMQRLDCVVTAMTCSEDRALAIRLTRVYAKLLGELTRIDNPPKRETRLKAARDVFDAALKDRDRRRLEISEALPHIAATAMFLDPMWSEETVKPIMPKERRRQAPPGGWAGAAFDVLESATEPMTIAAISQAIADRYDYDMGTTELRQRIHTTIYGNLIRYPDALVRDGGRPERWHLAKP